MREHVIKLREGVADWNDWRRRNPRIRPQLQCAELSGLDLRGYDLSHARLFRANLAGANLQAASLSFAKLTEADLSAANLSGADLFEAKLSGANLKGATLVNADLRRARLVETSLKGVTLTGSSVYGISAWNVCTAGATQSDLVISDEKKPRITVDDLEVAQFVYLLLNNPKIRTVIDTVARKAVLILGRFTPARKPVLDGLRNALRNKNYIPILFDFPKPVLRDPSETVSALAHMARFIVADLTAARSIPQELQRIVPLLPSVPVQPIIAASESPYAMFESLNAYPWVLRPHKYSSQKVLIDALEGHVIAPAEAKADELARLRAEFEDRLRS